MAGDAHMAEAEGALTLSLLRHGKSSWRDASLTDFDRPLKRRGEEAAARMGRFLAEIARLPDLVLCSTARRARDTLAILLAAADHTVEVAHERGLYHASADTLLARLVAIPPGPAHIMVVGHNPGLHALAHMLSGGRGARDAIERLNVKFPTAALAQIAFPFPDPRRITEGTGRLVLFATPKSLPTA